MKPIKTILSLLIFCWPFASKATPICGSQEIGGTVYRDFDSDGAMSSLEPGVSGITITAYNKENSVLATTTTDSNGEYKISLGASTSARVEFSGLSSYLKSGPHGTQSTTSIAFVNSSTGCNVNFAVSNPSDFCGSAPLLSTTCFSSGDPLQVGTSAAIDTIVSFPYSISGQPSQMTAAEPNKLTIASETGTVWGLAYQRSSNTLFTSAFLRRLAGFGPLGTGGIYSIDLAAGGTPVTNFVDLQSIGIATGVDPRVTSGIPLPPDVATPAEDSLASELIGRLSLGDIDISEDEEDLWVVNLFDTTVYRLHIGTPPVAPTALDVTSYPIPASLVNCSNNEFQAWGLGIRDEVVYVGVTCTAETSQLRADLFASVLSLDPSTGNFASIIRFSVNYVRGTVNLSTALANQWWPLPQDLFARWNPWLPGGQYSSFVGPVSNVSRTGYPQPLISDIEFDNDGSLILGLLDLTSLHLGLAVPFPSPYTGSGFVTAGFSGGDMMRVCRNSDGSYVLEDNGECPTGGAKSGQGNGQGPGGGEFYLDPRTGFEAESQLGGLAKLLGTSEIIANLFDPFQSNSAGTGTWDNTDGELSRAYELVVSTPGNGFGKSSSLGDLVILCDAAPIEIGNRVWIDTNKNGRQDSEETAISGVTISLYDGSDTFVSSTTTDSNGNYYFTVDPNTNYKIKVNTVSDYGVGGSLYGYKLTTTMSTSSTSTTDSNAAYDPTFPALSISTAGVGNNDHTFDLGFVSGVVTDQFASLISIDSDTLYLAALANKAVNRRVKGSTVGTCPSLKSSKITKIKTRISQLKSTIWTTTWSLPENTIDFTVIGGPPPYCENISSKQKLSALKADIKSLRGLAQNVLSPCTAKWAKNLRKQLITVPDAILASIAEQPTTTTRCPTQS